METTANIFIILSGILFGISMYFYLQNRRNKNKLERANSLLESEEKHRISMEDIYKNEVERQAKRIFEYKSKLKFAINNPPKFKVGDKIKNVVVESIELEKNKIKWLGPWLTTLVFGLSEGINSYKQQNKEKYIYKYELQHKDAHLGQKLTKETEVLTEEELLKLKQHKAKA